MGDISMTKQNCKTALAAVVVYRSGHLHSTPSI